ncbi:MAG: SH3 domain-containing protein [Chloroflexota bacterium]
MMRRMMLLLIVLMLGGVVSAQDSDAEWSVWVYDRNEGMAIQVDTAGVILENVTLPIPAPYNTFTFSENLAVSPDGNKLAYTVNGVNGDTERISTFIVYDTARDAVTFAYDTPEYALATSLNFGSRAFNSTGNVVAFGYATGDALETQTWELLVFNAVDGRILSDLTPEATYFENQADTLAPYLLPVIPFYGESVLTFSLIPYQTLDFSQDFTAYDWDIVTGRISRTDRAPRLTGDALSNGEIVTPTTDERVNYDTASAPYANALHVYRPELGAKVPFFATQTYDLRDVHFGRGGAEVIVLAEDFLTFEFVRLVVLRNGVSQTLPNINPVGNVTIGTPEGFAYVIDNPTPFLITVDTRDSEFPQTPIWQAPDGSQFVPVWASSSEDLSEEAWLQLAPPIFDTQSLIEDLGTDDSSDTGIAASDVSSAGVQGGAITIDTVAVINTTGGDRLNMRDAAGLSGSIIARVENGTRVVVLDGPVAIDGFTWWEVRLPTGLEGWVVERADGVQTLLPVN